MVARHFQGPGRAAPRCDAEKVVAAIGVGGAARRDAATERDLPAPTTERLLANANHSFFAMRIGGARGVHAHRQSAVERAIAVLVFDAVSIDPAFVRYALIANAFGPVRRECAAGRLRSTPVVAMAVRDPAILAARLASTRRPFLAPHAVPSGNAPSARGFVGTRLLPRGIAAARCCRQRAEDRAAEQRRPWSEQPATPPRFRQHALATVRPSTPGNAGSS